ncbi:MAG: hypothetical protein HYR88_07250, partial [Verrucomicrobia bacterium]|nr:hypothetical protein [Verrucomicrobiota bacterium]
EPLPRARADTALIRQVLVSYLSNAIKYTRTRAVAEIRVGTQKAGSSSEVIVYVHDNGVGFDRAYVSKLFRPFQRLHSQAEFEGSGMGLANAHRVISRHGGKTWAEAQPDQGATFYFSLPAHPQEANAGTRAEAGTQAFSDGPANSAARSAPKSSA